MISERVLQGTSLKSKALILNLKGFFNFDFTAINIGENSLTQFQQENCRVSGKVNCSTISYSSVILRRSLELYYILGNTTSETTSQLSFFFRFYPQIVILVQDRKTEACDDRKSLDLFSQYR